MRAGKHTYEAKKIQHLEEEIQELNEVIKRKDKEINDIKKECVEQFEEIKDIALSNEYGGTNDKFKKLKKIHEIASENSYILGKDIYLSKTEENAKIIELPNTRKSN